MNGRTGGKLGSAAVWAAVWAAGTIALPSVSLAQATPPPSTAISPPRAKTPDKPPLLGNIAVAILVLGVVVGASLIPSKRGHQD